MNNATWEEDRALRAKKSLNEHKRLHKLYVEDSDAFERERVRMIAEVINGAKSEKERMALRAMQDEWDATLDHAESPQSRLALAQFLFWKQIGQVWGPSVPVLDRFSEEDTS